jgi:hypothetical protein
VRNVLPFDRDGVLKRAAAAILRELPDAQASAGERSIAGHIPLPKKRPIPRTPPDRQ